MPSHANSIVLNLTTFPLLYLICSISFLMLISFNLTFSAWIPAGLSTVAAQSERERRALPCSGFE